MLSDHAFKFLVEPPNKGKVAHISVCILCKTVIECNFRVSWIFESSWYRTFVLKISVRLPRKLSIKTGFFEFDDENCCWRAEELENLKGCGSSRYNRQAGYLGCLKNMKHDKYVQLLRLIALFRTFQSSLSFRMFRSFLLLTLWRTSFKDSENQACPLLLKAVRRRITNKIRFISERLNGFEHGRLDRELTWLLIDVLVFPCWINERMSDY